MFLQTVIASAFPQEALDNHFNWNCVSAHFVCNIIDNQLGFFKSLHIPSIANSFWSDDIHAVRSHLCMIYFTNATSGDCHKPVRSGLVACICFRISIISLISKMKENPLFHPLLSRTNIPSFYINSFGLPISCNSKWPLFCFLSHFLSRIAILTLNFGSSTMKWII